MRIKFIEVKQQIGTFYRAVLSSTYDYLSVPQYNANGEAADYRQSLVDPAPPV